MVSVSSASSVMSLNLIDSNPVMLLAKASLKFTVPADTVEVRDEAAKVVGSSN